MMNDHPLSHAFARRALNAHLLPHNSGRSKTTERIQLVFSYLKTVRDKLIGERRSGAFE